MSSKSTRTRVGKGRCRQTGQKVQNKINKQNPESFYIYISFENDNEHDVPSMNVVRS